MMLRIFAIFDSKAKAYLPPFFLPEIGQAVRSFGDALNDPKHQFAMHPEDYALVHLGEFNAVTGVIHAAPNVTTVMTGLQVKARYADRNLSQLSMRERADGADPDLVMERAAS